MKVFLINVDLRQLARLVPFKKEKPVIRHRVKNEPVDIKQQWQQYWFGRTEPADAWLIE